MHMQPVQLYTGKQLFNVLFRPNRECNVLINHRGGGKNYKTTLEEMDPTDTYVVIRNSELLCGMMDKSILGSGNKKSIFHLLLRDFGPDAAAARMSRLAKLCARFLSEYSHINIIVSLMCYQLIEDSPLELMMCNHHKN